MPTEFVSLINGTGTNPGGYDAAYTTLLAWDTARRGDITSAGRDTIEIAELVGGINANGSDTAELKIQQSLWTTDATNYIVIRAQAGSEYQGTGQFDTSKAYLLRNAGGTNSYCIRSEEYLRLENIQLVHTGGLPNSHCFFGQLGEGSLTMDGCLVRHSASTTSGNYEGCCVEIRSPTADSIFRNCIMISEFSANADASSMFFCQGALNGNFDFAFYNCTLAMTGGTGGTKTCISLRDGCTATIDNCYLAVPSNSSRFTSFAQLGSTITTGSNNATSDLGTTPYSTSTFTSVTSGSEDLTPTDESPLANAGADLTSEGVTVDIVGTSRPQGAAFDIGAVEIAAATPDPEPSEGVTMKLETRSFSTTHTTKSATFQSSSFDVSRASEVVIALDFTLTTAGTTGGFTPSIQFNSEADGSGTWSNSVYLTDGVTTMAAVAYAGAQVAATGSQFYRLPAHGALMRVNYTYAGDRTLTIKETVTIVPVHR